LFSIRDLLLQHGYLFLFTYIFMVQLGIPVPADPVLLIMGALVGDRFYSFWYSLLIGLSAALTGDLIWYELGRRRGRSILGLLCRFSLEPDNCVRKTESTFARRGASTLVFGKFIPGMGLMLMPLSGMTRMPRWRFLLFDAMGATLWISAYLLAGLILHKQVDAAIIFIGLLGRRAGIVVACLIGGYLLFKYWQRQALIRELRIRRISPHELLAMMESGKSVSIVDLRHPAEVERDGSKLAGALVIRPDELRSRSGEIPRDQEIILYCT
jgi:membrane protein DedA with SNARE-associated domain